LPARLTKIDELTRSDHSYLREEDECYYAAEYTARGGYAYSASNNLILNLKKSVTRRGLLEYRYKIAAISEAAITLRDAIRSEFLATATLVPIPPSRAKDDPEYDDRIVQMLKIVGTNADIRELIIQTASLPSYHAGSGRRSPQLLAEYYAIDETLASPAPKIVALFDDVITTGSHFRAATKVINDEYIQK
jgi:predicted amidophosphoribosyltransferase